MYSLPEEVFPKMLILKSQGVLFFLLFLLIIVGQIFKSTCDSLAHLVIQYFLRTMNIFKRV